MKRYTFIDYTTQAYIALIALLILFFHNQSIPGWPWLLAAHAVGMGAVHWLVQTRARHPENCVLNFVRHFYPVMLYLAFYRETGELNHLFACEFLDSFFIRLDERIFGGQPSISFMPHMPYWPVSEIFFAAYFSYYVMIVVLAIALFMRDRGQFFHYVSVLSFIFYVCYLVYIFMPVIGPRIFHLVVNGYSLPPDVQPAVLPDFPATLKAGPFFRLMSWLYDIFEAPGAAFPSSHVAAAIGMLYFSSRYLPRIRIGHSIVVVLLCLATVYCRYHYAVDVIAGILAAALLIPIGNWLYFQFRCPQAETTEVTTTARALEVQGSH